MMAVKSRDDILDITELVVEEVSQTQISHFNFQLLTVLSEATWKEDNLMKNL
jgi:hypothetical protein